MLSSRAQFGAVDQYRDRQGAAGGRGEWRLFPHCGLAKKSDP